MTSTGLSGRIATFFLESKLTPLLVVASLLLGGFAIAFTAREEEPQISVPMLDVFVPYPGASPEEVDRRIAQPLEKRVWEIPGVEYVYTTSLADVAMLVVRFEVGHDMEAAVTKLYAKMGSAMDAMPAGARMPLVKPRAIYDVPFLALTLWGEGYDGFVLRRLTAELEAELKRVPDVAETWIIGGQRREVAVTLDPARLAAYGISAAQVAEALQAASVEVPASTLESGDVSMPVRIGALLTHADDVRRLVVGASRGGPLYLGDLAAVSDGPEEPATYVSHIPIREAAAAEPGTPHPAVTLALAKREGTNATTLAESVLDRVDALRGRLLPDDVRLTVTRNYGETASEKARELILHILLATLAVTFLVGLALGWREAVVVLIAVPVTLALTLAIYRLYGYTLNRITLFALIFAIGILVDDAIVVVENIYRHFQLHERAAREAAIVAVDEVGNPTILATFTVIAAILPMAFVSGLMGPYMRPIPVGASVAMLFSLAVAFIVTPYFALRLLRGHVPASGAGGTARPVEETRAYRAYDRLLRPLLRSRRRRFLAYSGMVALLLLSGGLLAVRAVDVKMLPFDNKSEFQVIVDTPEGTTLETTTRIAHEIADHLAGVPEVTHMQVYGGTAAPFNFNGLVRHYFLRSGPNVADVQVNLRPKDERSAQSHDIALRVRPALDSIARAWDASVKLVEIPPGPPVQATLVAEVYGPDYETQLAVAARIREVFEETDGVVDVDWSAEAKGPQLELQVDRAKAALAGVPVATAVHSVAALLGGTSPVLLRAPEAAEPVPVRLRAPRRARATAEDLEGVYVPSATGAQVPLSELVTARTVTVPRAIHRKNLKPVVYVTADVAGAVESPIYAILVLKERLARLDLPEAVGIEQHFTSAPALTETPALKWDGEWQITYEVFRDLGLAFAVVLVLIYVLVVAWFQDFWTPLVIMAPIPLTLVGILPAHGLAGAFFTATSMIGMIALAGIIVRNSILLVDFMTLARERGHTLEEAVLQAAAVRTRPIVLTALAVVIGGFVMVRDPIFEGLGLAMIGGAVVATALTLVLVPALYWELETVRARAARRPTPEAPRPARTWRRLLRRRAGESVTPHAE